MESSNVASREPPNVAHQHWQLSLVEVDINIEKIENDLLPDLRDPRLHTRIRLRDA